MTLPPRAAPIDLVVDSSALVAMLLDEPSADSVHVALAASRGAVVSAASIVESAIVASSRLGDAGRELLDDLLRAGDVVTMPVDTATVDGAHDAWVRFGKGRHPAALNYGDCFTYALAKHLDVPVLCVGDDFAATDLRVTR